MKGGGEGNPMLYSSSPPVTTTMKENRLKGKLVCLFCCCFFLFIILVIIAVILSYSGGQYYTLHNPKPPTYHVHSFVVKNLHVQPDNLSLKTHFLVHVKTNNPNKNIGFIYGADSKVSVLYNDAVISSGKLPAFKQDPTNTTLVKFALAGTSRGKEFKDQGAGIPLVVKVKVPMKIFVGNLHFKEFINASVTCDLMVDNLEKGKTTKVLQNQCKPDVKF